MLAWKAVSKAATCGTPGKRASAASMPAIAAGLCSGASSASLAISSRTCASTSIASRKRVPPCTTRWPIASTEPTWPSAEATSRSWRPASLPSQLASPCCSTLSVAASSTTHLRLLDPVFTMRTDRFELISCAEVSCHPHSLCGARGRAGGAARNQLGLTSARRVRLARFSPARQRHGREPQRTWRDKALHAEVSAMSDVATSERLTAGVLSDDLLRRMDAYWRAANYLSVGQIYLLDNPL